MLLGTENNHNLPRTIRWCPEVNGSKLKLGLKKEEVPSTSNLD